MQTIEEVSIDPTCLSLARFHEDDSSYLPQFCKVKLLTVFPSHVSKKERFFLVKYCKDE